MIYSPDFQQLMVWEFSEMQVVPGLLFLTAFKDLSFLNLSNLFLSLFTHKISRSYTTTFLLGIHDFPSSTISF